MSQVMDGTHGCLAARDCRRQAVLTSEGAMHYTVINYTTCNAVYSGTSEACAAQALEPGTTYGKGAEHGEAASQAMSRAYALRQQMLRRSA